jgi:hypothetical protein
MNAINLHPLKKLEIILEGADKEFATDLLDRAGGEGLHHRRQLSGKGSHGMYKGHLMFNGDRPHGQVHGVSSTGCGCLGEASRRACWVRNARKDCATADSRLPCGARRTIAA